ncbi:queuosine precursor transporter [Candidatus Thiosymbion oneisti]|uniref:queuosine precursor transporter n=1 Tax=Candidatus Thiosymbion oneisti TaxID=589554 RepID=UPI000AE6D740|nr:queuosine precursor transporter [Candidatus Thiosymbion oneisti]
MSNELLFFIITLVDLAFVLLAWKLGKEWVYITIITNIILVSTFAAKLIPIFGFVTNVSNTFYAAIFIATDILTEHHGKKVGYRSIWMGFIGLVLFVLLGQFVLQFEYIQDSEKVSIAMETLFSAVPRIAAASFIAYAIAQSLDVWLFHFIRERTRGKHLWFRNNGSTLVSQFIDSAVFFSLAFAGSVPFDVLVNIILTGYVVKLMVALLDTPFIYLSYKVKGMAMPDIGGNLGVQS